MGQITFRGKLTAAFGAALIVLASVGVLSYRRVLQEDSDQKWVEHSHLVSEKLDAVLTDLIDEETGQRGYTISRDEAFLEPYYAGRAHLQQHITDLRQLTSDNSIQKRALDHLEPLVTARLGIFESQTRAAASQGNHEIAGKQLMDQIRTLLLQMKTE